MNGSNRVDARLIALATLALIALLQPVAAQAQTITTVAGTGDYDYSGDGGQATGAALASPIGVTADSAGNYYIADTENYVVRKVNAAGIISTFAGTGAYGFSGDGGPATNASFDYVSRVTIDAGGNVYIADYGNNRIRKVSPAGIITTVAGNGSGFYSGDGGPAINAGLILPIDVSVDATGNLFIAEYLNHRIRKVGINGIITTIAGTGIQGFSGDGGPAVAANLSRPSSVIVRVNGDVYFADRSNHRIRRIDAGTGTITTVAGNGTIGFSGDGGQATAASLRAPWDIEFDAAGNLYIADSDNNRVRRVTQNGIISTIAGDGTHGFGGDNGPATDAMFRFPSGLSVVGSNLYVADANNNRIRKVELDIEVATPTEMTMSLTAMVNDLNLDKQVANSLLAPLKTIVKLLEDGNPNNDGAVCGKLDDFIANTEAKVASGKLDEPSGISLIMQGEAIKTSLACP